MLETVELPARIPHLNPCLPYMDAYNLPHLSPPPLEISQNQTLDSYLPLSLSLAPLLSFPFRTIEMNGQEGKKKRTEGTDVNFVSVAGLLKEKTVGERAQPTSPTRFHHCLRVATWAILYRGPGRIWTAVVLHWAGPSWIVKRPNDPSCLISFRVKSELLFYYLRVLRKHNDFVVFKAWPCWRGVDRYM